MFFSFVHRNPASGSESGFVPDPTRIFNDLKCWIRNTEILGTVVNLIDVTCELYKHNKVQHFMGGGGMTILRVLGRSQEDGGLHYGFLLVDPF
jgi:hypothetical protein